MTKLGNKKNKKVKGYFKGNNNLEILTPYGMIFIILFSIVFVFQYSFYFYMKEEIRYIFWASIFIMSTSLISCFYIWKFKLKLKGVNFEFPKEINVGEVSYINNNFKNIKKNNENIYVRFKVKSDPSLNDEDLENMRLLFNNSHEKWENTWSYSSKLGFNSYDVFPLDFEQVNLKKEKIAVYGKRRGQVEILGVYLYLLDIFGLLRVRRFIKFQEKVVINILPNKNIEKKSKFKDIDRVVSDKGVLTNSNIIGIRKGRRNDSFKNTHWKIFAKKEEQWVFVKEKEDKKPSLLWVDITMEDPKNQSEQFETMLSDLLMIANKKMIDGIVLGNEFFTSSEFSTKLIEKIVKVNVNGENIDDFKIISSLDRFNLIIGLTVNNEKENEKLEKIKQELNKRKKTIKVIVYE